MSMATLTRSSGVRRPKSRWLSWTRSPWLVPLPGFVLLALLSVPPFLYALYLSFINVDISLPNQPRHFVWFDNYMQVLGTANGSHALMITLIVSFGSTFAAVAIGLLIAYLIHLFAGRLDGLVTILVLIPLAVSPVAMALIFSLMLDPLYGPVPQVINIITGALIAPTGTSLGALLTIIFVQTWQWSPLSVILLLGGIKSLPIEPIEAAKIDGASFWRALWHIHLPLLRPLLAVAGIFEFILCSQVFAATELLTNGGPGNATVDLSLYIYKIGISESSQVSVASAAGVITLLLGLISTAVWLKIAKWDTEVYR
ncbi:carbohydrate ABC transporter permease [Acidisoma cladoniae]|jgi:multiple sugar transport system permease protein|uniref:carbohydrate ABC transporter permease n=1 Tax=Acidisoma cladoniae TaxID=3040935 RepID=UPI00254A49E7|nr:sugar ABC transporter permease [Acidisoma sp. PAMC 29798]